LSVLQSFLDGEFRIQHGISPCKRHASPHSGRIEKYDPFPATWICRLDNFELHAFVFHGRSSKRRHGIPILPRDSCLRREPLGINFFASAFNSTAPKKLLAFPENIYPP
jgi:hypothetical protein